MRATNDGQSRQRPPGKNFAENPPYPRTAAPPHLLIILFGLISVIVGLVASLLAWGDGRSVPAAILYGGGAFAGTIALLVAVAHYLERGTRSAG